MPPPAEGFAARFVIGPALRTQPDRRLVTLVREGYENAFEEIVRRYGRALTRYAAAIVGSRAEDVTQDAFSKALLALRRDGAEIELRPWLFRIVRNTALNDLRDSPPSAEALAEVIASGASPAEEMERREELADLMRRLQSLPEAQRAAIVMRELEGLSHEEIANALGLSDGGARQAIYRARRSLRDGAGLLLPLPLLKALLAGAAGAPIEVAAGVGGAAGAGVALKAAAATVLVAGAVGAGVAIDHDGHPHHPASSPPASGIVADDAVTTPGVAFDGAPDATGGRGSSGGPGRSGEPEPGDDHGGQGHGHGSGKSGDDHSGHSDNSGGGVTSGNGENRGPGGGGGQRTEGGDDHGGGQGPSGHDGSDGGDGGGDHSGRGSAGSSGSSSGGSSDGGGSGSNSGPGSGSSSDSSGSTADSGSGSGSSEGSGSGGGGSGSGGESVGSEPNFYDSGDSHGGDGFSVQKEPPTEEEP